MCRAGHDNGPAQPYHPSRMSAASARAVVSYITRERSRMPRPALETLVLGAYQRGLLSGGESAGILGRGLAAFLKFASREGVPVLDQTPRELREDLRRVRLVSPRRR